MLKDILFVVAGIALGQIPAIAIWAKAKFSKIAVAVKAQETKVESKI